MSAGAESPHFTIINESASPAAASAISWAITQVSGRLAVRGWVVAAGDVAPSVATIRLVDEDADEPEAYVVTVEGQELSIGASDARGFSYGLLDLVDAADGIQEPAQLLSAVTPGRKSSAVPVRGVQRSFANVDQDSNWFHDRAFWTEYLDWIAASRFNRFNLTFGMQYNYSHDTVTDNYLCFVYPFLFAVEGFDVQAANVDAAEQQRNLDSLRFISAETKRRGVNFQLGLWNHAYNYGVESHERFPISGVDDANHADYSSAALAKLLDECPDIDGFTFRVHYEGGIKEEGHEIFWDKMFTAASNAGRDLEIDMHAKGVDQLLIDSLADKPGLRPVISAKYWAEHFGLPYHQASIRDHEAARPVREGEELRGVTNFSRRFTRYGYGDFLAENRQTDLIFRIWPGTQRLLLWGDPAIAAGYGRYSTFAGARGMDLCEPLFFKGRDNTGVAGGHDPYLDPELQLGTADWKKYKYTYLLWGRLLHDPEASPRVWRSYLEEEYGTAAAEVEGALSALSRILPLVTVTHGASGANNLYWPEMYVNLPISSRLQPDVPVSERKPDPRAEKYGISYAYAAYLDDRQRGEQTFDYTSEEEADLIAEIVIHDTDDAKNWGGISPFDPTLFMVVDEFVDDVLHGRVPAKYSPLEVAGWLEDLVRTGSAHLKTLQGHDFEGHTSANAQLRRTLVDLEVLAALGTYFAAKFRAAVHYAVFTATQDPAALARCIEAYQPGRDAYAGIADVVEGVYQPGLMFGKEAFEGGTWGDRVPGIDRDLAALRRELAELPESRPDAVDPTVSIKPRLASAGLDHEPPAFFVRTEALELRAAATGEADLTEVILHYRHADQSQRFQEVVMERVGNEYVATIGADYTTTTYPLIYFFSVIDSAGRSAIAPGFQADLSNQPYILLHSSEREH